MRNFRGKTHGYLIATHHKMDHIGLLGSSDVFHVYDLRIISDVIVETGAIVAEFEVCLGLRHLKACFARKSANASNFSR